MKHRKCSTKDHRDQRIRQQNARSKDNSKVKNMGFCDKTNILKTLKQNQRRKPLSLFNIRYSQKVSLNTVFAMKLRICYFRSTVTVGLGCTDLNGACQEFDVDQVIEVSFSLRNSFPFISSFLVSILIQ